MYYSNHKMVFETLKFTIPLNGKYLLFQNKSLSCFSAFFNIIIVLNILNKFKFKSVNIIVIIIIIIIIIFSIKTIEPMFYCFGASCFNCYAFECENLYKLLTSLKYFSTWFGDMLVEARHCLSGIYICAILQ